MRLTLVFSSATTSIHGGAVDAPISLGSACSAGTITIWSTVTRGPMSSSIRVTGGCASIIGGSDHRPPGRSDRWRRGRTDSLAGAAAGTAEGRIRRRFPIRWSSGTHWCRTARMQADKAGRPDGCHGARRHRRLQPARTGRMFGWRRGRRPPTTVTAAVTIASTTVAPSTTSAPTTTLSPQQRDEAEIRNSTTGSSG